MDIYIANRENVRDGESVHYGYKLIEGKKKALHLINVTP